MSSAQSTNTLHRTILHVRRLPDNKRLRIVSIAIRYALFSSADDAAASRLSFNAPMNSSNSALVNKSLWLLRLKLLAIEAMSMVSFPRDGI